MLKIAAVKLQSPTITATKRRRKTRKKEINDHADAEKKITDYFPVRRSSRKAESILKKEKQLLLEECVVHCDESDLEVCTFNDKGRGVKAKKSFRRGDFVVEYKGDLIDREAAKKREEVYEQDESVGCYMYYFEHNNKQYCVDATSESHYLGRLVNHSAKEPNCVTKVVCVDGEPHLILVADRSIEIGEELLYDYGDRSRDSIKAHPWLLTT